MHCSPECKQLAGRIPDHLLHPQGLEPDPAGDDAPEATNGGAAAAAVALPRQNGVSPPSDSRRRQRMRSLADKGGSSFQVFFPALLIYLWKRSASSSFAVNRITPAQDWGLKCNRMAPHAPEICFGIRALM